MTEAALPPAVIVAGPTCSGKSALAMVLAERLGGVVINADSMQVYRELRVLTARPSEADERRVAHRLYGVRAAAAAGSAAWWRIEALAAMAAARDGNRVPILCGGTGLYLACLTQGIAPIPDVGAEARGEARALLEEGGPEALHARLARHDPETAGALQVRDGQRIARAWEVWRGTGRGLAAWQAVAPELPPWRFRLVLLDPPRAELREAIAGRFAGMLRQGGLAEAAALLALGLDPALPAMRAQGVPELALHLRGEISLEEASRRAVLASGQYTKRQSTWFRHRAPACLADTHVIHARFAGLEQFSESEWAYIQRFVIGQA